MPSTQTLVLSAALIAGGTIIAMLVIKGRQDSTITAASILDPKTSFETSKTLLRGASRSTKPIRKS